MDYRSVADLNADVRRMAWDLPRDVDAVVGISRGGVLAADLLHQTTGRPVLRLDDGTLRTGSVESGATVLALTDALLDGVPESPVTEDDGVEVLTGAVYVGDGVETLPDLWVDRIATPCAFEWRALHPTRLGNACVDIDGVLCRDPTPEENDDGPRYREFLRSVEPRLIPDERVGWLVTCRLEQYRPETEQWLAEHGVEYDELVMWDLPNKAARDEQGGHGEYKAEVYDRVGADIFIESSEQQAVVIAREAGKPVYCFDTNQTIPPGEAADEYGYDSYLVRFAENPRSFLRTAGRHVASKGVDTVTQTAGMFR
ncbi:orotate phosphoribosyltransferase [Halomarina rubra]|uniref:Orotate phosphoribosyltransferase n=1 Tax=Halomarina rubra TaxID=2071873 RepID=A0ABD6AY30_9EURY|nr:orotate phosphoribosyltransferase [Halomarina rubra]